MKYSILFSCFLISIQLAAQPKPVFYDFYWRPCKLEQARFYSITKQTDSGWLRQDYFISNQQLQMRALYEDAACKIQNGRCVYFHANGRVSLDEQMLHGKREGVCVNYYFNGMMADSAFYHDNKPVGSRVYWHRNGYMSDSVFHVNDSMDTQMSWGYNGSPSAAGYYKYGKQYGKWQYMHPNGKIAAYEVYKDGEIISQEYFNEDGSLQPDVNKANQAASFKNNGLEGWKKYMNKNLYWPHDYKLVNADSVTVGLEFTINTEGRIVDIDITIPFNDEFDMIAEKIMRTCPLWKPAIQHNRKVEERYLQAVTFIQEE